jgi:histone deacetylase 1/2
MSQFHTDEYVDFLYRINPENANGYAREQQKCERLTSSTTRARYLQLNTRLCSDNVGDDSPIFDGLFEYCSISAGGSMGQSACRLLVRNSRLTTIYPVLPVLQRAQRDCPETSVI